MYTASVIFSIRGNNVFNKSVTVIKKKRVVVFEKVLLVFRMPYMSKTFKIPDKTIIKMNSHVFFESRNGFWEGSVSNGLHCKVFFILMIVSVEFQSQISMLINRLKK